MFHGMNYIYAVYKEGGFSKAAEKLYISQPSLSASVKKVEQEVGTPLFDRGFVPIKLTEVGKLYIEIAEKIMNLQNDFCKELNDINDIQSGEIRIGGSHLVSSYIISRIFNYFGNKYPKIKITFVEDSSIELLKKLQNDEIDMLIDSKDFDENTFKIIPLADEKIMIAVSNKNKINKKLANFLIRPSEIFNENIDYSTRKPLKIDEFKNEKLLMLKSGNDMYKRALKIFDESKIEPNISLYLDQLHTSYALVTENIGICFVTDTLFRYHRLEDDTSLYMLKSQFNSRQLCLVCKKNKYISKAMQKFIEISKLLINNVY